MMQTATIDAAGVVGHITAWLKEYAEKSGTKGFVVGISGGIDSAVTSALGARTGLPVLCCEMPIHQNASQVTRARRHIDWLIERYPDVSRVEVDLTPVFDGLIDALPGVEIGPNESRSHDMALVNSRARLRMTTLYYFAAAHHRLVLGTGNKVEDFGVGFYTKYGDGGVDLSPIADLVKTEVYAVAAALGINEDIMTAPPTDGLWGDDRTDEDQIGASYPELEWAMSFEETGGDEKGLDDRQRVVLAIYRRMHAANRHKMDPIPVCMIPDSLRH
ncbi:MAG: NAD(+) synthase [Rhodospirillales bacterium]